METADIPMKAPSPWMPEADPYTVAILGKLGEEASELAVKLFRAIIQGLDQCDPETGKPNALAIRDEIADVLALADNAIQRLDMDERAIELRAKRKGDFKRPWFDGLRQIKEANPHG